MDKSIATGLYPGRRLSWVRAAGVIGALFGLLTIREGGAVLFVDGAGRAAAGDFVPFVLWFNFLAGFAYLVAGVGLWFRQAWAARIALAIALATLGVFVAFGVYVVSGGAFEMRTVVAMTLRSGIWLAIAAIGWRTLLRQRLDEFMQPGT
jgi:hypothetical protein